MEELIRSRIEDHVAIVELNDPESRNSLSERLCFQLIATLEQLANNDDAHVILITGAGDAFCAGGNIREFSTFREKRASEIHKEGKGTTELFKTVTTLTKPLIGAVNGHALGGGFGLVAACHYAVASSKAKLGTTEIKLGLFPLVILPVIIEAIGSKKALELGFTGRILKAEEAKELGLINQVAEPEDVFEEAFRFAKQLAAASPLALKIGMDCYVNTRGMDWSQKFDYANTLRIIAYQSEDLQEGALAFLEKRQPQWTGK